MIEGRGQPLNGFKNHNFRLAADVGGKTQQAEIWKSVWSPVDGLEFKNSWEWLINRHSGLQHFAALLVPGSSQELIFRPLQVWTIYQRDGNCGSTFYKCKELISLLRPLQGFCFTPFLAGIQHGTWRLVWMRQRPQFESPSFCTKHVRFTVFPMFFGSLTSPKIVIKQWYPPHEKGDVGSQVALKSKETCQIMSKTTKPATPWVLVAF